MRRIIPVNQARVHLTNMTSAIAVAFFEPSTSANQRGDGKEVDIKFNTVSDSGKGDPLNRITPTI